MNKVVNIMKEKLNGIKAEAVHFLSGSSNEYEPLSKCSKTFWGSIAGLVFTTFILVISTYKHSQYVEIIISILGLCIVIAISTLISGCKMIKDIEQGIINSCVVTVISAKKINISRRIEVVTEDEENIEFIMESDVKMKVNHKYKVFYYESNGEYIITYAKQISKNKKNKEYDEGVEK